MVTAPFIDEEGEIQRPRSVTMSTETLIDNSSKDSKLTTRTKAKRQFDGQHVEPEICAETSVSDKPPPAALMIPNLENSPRRVRRSSVGVAPANVPAVTAGPTQPTTTEPVTTIPDTTKSAKQPQSQGKSSTASKIPTKTDLSSSAPSLRTRERRGVSDPHLLPTSSTTASKPMPATSTSTVASSTKSPRTSIKSPPAFLESSLDDFEHIDDSSCIPSQDRLLKRAGEFQKELRRSQEELARVSSRVSPGIDKKSRREQIKESARRGQLFSDIDRSLHTKSLSFADLVEDASKKRIDEEETPSSAHFRQRKHSVDVPAEKPMTVEKFSPKLKSCEELNGNRKSTTLLPPPGKLKTTPSGTELITRITRRTHPEEVSEGTTGVKQVIKPKRSKMILEQDIKSGDGIYDTNGCHMTSTITVDNPSVKKKMKKMKGLSNMKKASSTILGPVPSSSSTPGTSSSFFGRLLRKSSQQHLMIRDGQENRHESETGRSDSDVKTASTKQFSKSMGDLRAEDLEEDDEDETEDDGQGMMVTDTKFERMKPAPSSGRNRNDTSWEYSMQCNCVNGLNTSLR